MTQTRTSHDRGPTRSTRKRSKSGRTAAAGTILRESDMAAAMCAALRAEGLEIRSEVHHVDIVARGEDGLFHAVEMKRAFNIDVLSQGLRGQRWAGMASILVPAPKGRGLEAGRKVAEWRRICRGLSLGLYLAEIDPATGAISVRLVAMAVRVSDGRVDMRKEFRKQFDGRSADRNLAGSPGVRLHTAYSEKVFRIARWLIDRALQCGGSAAIPCAEIAAGSGYPDARQVMYANYREFFVRKGGGRYALGRGVLADAARIAEVTGPFDVARLDGMIPALVGDRTTSAGATAVSERMQAAT